MNYNQPSRSYPPGNRQGRSPRSEKKHILKLFRLMILAMIAMIIILSLTLFVQKISASKKAASNEAKASLSLAAENTIPLTTIAATPTPVVTPPELLPTDPIVEAFFGPLPTIEEYKKIENFPVKAIYIAAAANLQESINLAKNSEINTFIVDLKESDGVAFNSQNPLAAEIDFIKNRYNLENLVKTCHENSIRVIGRIVCFKDPILAEKKPEYAIQDASGNRLFYKIESSKAFVSPYKKEIWDYNIALAEEAILAGVDEIQFDYVRFPTGNTTTGEKEYFGDPASVPTKAQAINRFLQTARILLQDKYGVPVGADVFGIILTSELDGSNLGQDWKTIGLTGIDNLAPMIYPSHYAFNTQLNGKTFEKPDKEPYGVMYNALMMGKSATEQAGYAAVRPYLQAFTATYLKNGNFLNYKYYEIDQQIKAINDAGFEQWILWNAGASYPQGVYDGKS